MPAGRLAKTTRHLEDGTPVSIQTDYDNQFNLLRVIDPLGRNVETYTLDIQDRVTSVTNLMGQVMTVDYGVADIVHSVTRFDGTTVSNSYDGQARLIAQNLPGLTNEFTYTPGGRLIEASGAGVTVSNVFDGFGRLLAQHQTGAGPAQAVAYTWHPVGTVLNITTAAGTWTHRYDPASRLTNLVSESGSFVWNYNPDSGLPSLRTTDTGLNVERQYDILDRLTNLVWRNASNDIIRSFAYTYTETSMIEEISRESGERRIYEYDSIDQLLLEQVEGSTTNAASYLYDLAGNRLQKLVNGTSNQYILGMGNQLSTFGVNGAMSYDSAGNVTNALYDDGRNLSLSWDGAYRLTSIFNTGTIVEAYGYDTFDRLIWISDGVETNHFIYAGPHVLADTDSAGTVTRSYTYGPGTDNILSMTVYTGGNTSTYWYVTDHLNTVWALVDDNGVVAESYNYDTWGNVSVFDESGAPLTESAVGNRFLFHGREYSWTTEFYYFRARWYDPVTARWLSLDPIGIAGGINLYQAFNNNPLNFIDPFGLEIYPTTFIGPIRPNDQRGLTHAQYRALRTVLERERKNGPRKAAQMSSITFGDGLLSPFNSSYGHTVPTRYGHMDLDWFTDSRAYSYGGRYTVLQLYIGGKLYWTAKRKAMGIPIGNPWPFQDSGERAAIMALIEDLRYGDLFDENFFQTYAPLCD